MVEGGIIIGFSEVLKHQSRRERELMHIPQLTIDLPVN